MFYINIYIYILYMYYAYIYLIFHMRVHVYMHMYIYIYVGHFFVSFLRCVRMHGHVQMQLAHARAVGQKTKQVSVKRAPLSRANQPRQTTYKQSLLTMFVMIYTCIYIYIERERGRERVGILSYMYV